MDTATFASPYERVGAKFIDNGFSAIPVMPGAKIPGERRNGKWLPMFDWQRFGERSPTQIEVGIWGKWEGAGVCVVLGGPDDAPHHVVAVDVDTTDERIIVAIRGVLPASPVERTGKTLLAMALAGSVGSGHGFLNWEGSGECKRVLYLDGELPQETFKERCILLARQFGADIAFYGYNRDALGDDAMPPLNTVKGMDWLADKVERIRPDLIICDSIMCLLTGNMADEESWEPIKPMVRWLSERRIAQIWLHHTGHDTSKGYGTKTREWEMDTVVSLTNDGEGNVLLEFKKSRLRTPDNRDQFEPLKIRCEADGWEIVGSVDKRRGPKGDEGAVRARRFLEAYDRLALDAPNSSGFNGKPVKKVALEAVRKEMRSRGALGDSTPGVKMTRGEYKAFDKAREANTGSKKLIEADGFVWR